MAWPDRHRPLKMEEAGGRQPIIRSLLAQEAHLALAGRKPLHEPQLHVTMIDEAAIRQEIDARPNRVFVHEDPFTPAGNVRKVPQYEATVENAYLGEIKTLRGKSVYEVETKARAQFERWNATELKRRVAAAKDEGKARAAELTSEAEQEVIELRNLLLATLSVDDRLDWVAMCDSREYPPFAWHQTRPAEPVQSKPSFWQSLLPYTQKKRERQHQMALKKWQRRVTAWEEARDQAFASYEAERGRFAESQRRHNEAVAAFRQTFEAGSPEAIVEYAKAVFERSEHPSSFFREYEVGYDPLAQTLVVDVSLPDRSSLPEMTEYRFDAKKGEVVGKPMKKAEHEELYDSTCKQCVLRTLHEIFESMYTPHIMAAVVNGWVTTLDRATGHDVTSCIISISSDRDDFEQLNLARVDPTECIKVLKGLVAGPLANVSPVKPILQLDRTDRRFVESREVLAEYNSTTNLAEIPWEEFEHLVRELFSQMFSSDGSDVRVTQASRDGGIDAIAFDPDPIRGGKYVIQAKRYTRVVDVSAVRDLYGTMIAEGATRGILVTTSHYGRDSHKFAKDKPITLIDGSNLVYLLEQHGHQVRIDIDAARSGAR